MLTPTYQTSGRYQECLVLSLRRELKVRG